KRWRALDDGRAEPIAAQPVGSREAGDAGSRDQDVHPRLAPPRRGKRWRSTSPDGRSSRRLIGLGFRDTRMLRPAPAEVNGAVGATGWHGAGPGSNPTASTLGTAGATSRVGS